MSIRISGFLGTLILLMCFTKLSAQNYSFITAGNDSLIYSSCLKTSDHGYLLGGFKNDSTSTRYFIKLDSLANFQWGKVVSNPNQYAGYLKMKELSDGSFIILPIGSSSLMKLSSSGNLIWNRIYTDTNYVNAVSYNFLNDFDLMSNGNIVMAGVQQDNSGLMKAWLQVADTAGNIVWSNGYNYCNYFDQFQAVTHAMDGGITTAGIVTDFTYTFGIEHYSLSGTPLWSTFFDFSQIPNFEIDRIIQTTDSSYIVLGKSDVLGHALIMKFSVTGNMIWSKIYASPHSDWFTDAIEDDQGYIVCGNTKPTPTCGINGMLFCIDKLTGNTIWQHFTGYSTTAFGLPITFYNVIKETNGYTTSGYTEFFGSNLYSFNSALLHTGMNGSFGCYDYTDSLTQIIFSPPIINRSLVNQATGNNVFNYRVYPSDYNYAFGVSQHCPLGVAESENPEIIQIYPNPSDGLFYFSSAETEIDLEIYNGSGQLIISQKFDAVSGVIDLSEFSEGLYFARFLKDGKIIAGKKLVRN